MILFTSSPTSTSDYLQPLSKELSCGNRAGRTQTGRFAETAVSVNSEAASGAADVALELAADAAPQLQLLLLRAHPSPGHMAPESWAAKCFVTCPARLEQLKKAKIPPETKR